jgi:hypothetical protein
VAEFEAAAKEGVVALATRAASAIAIAIAHLVHPVIT